MAQLDLTCFGDFQVALTSAPLTPFQTDKVRALLIYLAVEGQPHSRRALAQLLWHGYSEESANNSLRQTLHRLRQLLGDAKADPPWLLITRQTVQLNPAASVRVDVTTFTKLIADSNAHGHAEFERCSPCLARLRQAVDLYQGDFLAGFTVADSDPFEEWRRITQEHLHLQTLDALTKLANAAESAGDDEGALRDARHQLALEPWLEAAHRRVMRILGRRGQRAAALAQYQRCCQVLAEELGATPDQETVALYEQIQSSHFAKEIRRGGDKAIGRQATFPLPVVQPSSHLVSPAPLIGRTQALAEIGNQLQLPGLRLLTLVGPGGMGKTRLAVEVGREQLTAFADGVFFVPLAAISTPSALAPAIATALGLPLQGGDPRNAILQTLRPKQLLLILDNFEHLLGPATAAVDLVVEILAVAPAVQVLVTSRERLNLRNEQLYAVQPLVFAAAATLAEAATVAAVRLFVQSVQRVQPHFQLTETNLAAVLRICQLVQGMPLGLELAAANVGVLSLPALADAIAQNVEFLAADWRDMPERQRSMRAIFTWSWRLLDEQERQFFRQLAIFQGGFTRAAAERVTGATLPVLTRLIHKSLLQGSDSTAGDGRYLIHELLRQFAAAELAAAAEETTVANRHSEYYLSFLAAQQRHLMHAAPREAVQAIQGEIDNIRHAWRWGAGHLPATLVEQSAVTLREFYWLTGLTAEAIELFTLATQARHTHLLQHADPQAGQGTETRVYSILLGLSATFQITVGRHEEAFVSATEALQLAPVDANPAGAALAYMIQGQALRRQGQSAAALHLLARSVEIARQARAGATNPSLLLDIEKRAYSWLASIALSNDEYTLARAHSTYQLKICQEFQMVVGEVIALTCLIEIDKALGDYPRAQENAQHALATAHNVDFLWGQAICLEHLAEIAWVQGDYQQAQSLYEQTLVFFRNMNRTLEEATVSQMLGRLLLWLGDAARARTWIDQAFQLLQTLGSPARETFWATLSRARLYYLTNNPAQALIDAEQAWRMARQLDGGASQADALVLLGLVREQLDQADAAATAYREALTIYLALGHRHRTAEPRAGLARLALAAGALPDALVEIEAVLIILKSYPLAGFDEPFQVYLTCYTVLAAHKDGRATTVLTTAHELLTAYAERILDPIIRRAFLGNVAIHRDLAAAYRQFVPLPPPAIPSTRQPAPPHNLPSMLTALIGRARELADICARLQQPDLRLLTLVGAGGMGKTRLALAVAQAIYALCTSHAAESTAAMPNPERVPPLYPDGVFFVALAPLTTAAALAPTIADTLGLETHGDPQQTLQRFLQKKRLLLILDNFEHLLAGAKLIATLLQGAPGLQILVTSRERLNVRGEQLYPLSGLDYTSTYSQTTAPTSAAVQLFVQSAQQTHAEFALHAADYPAVVRICQLVQGTPLGLEMAAAWTMLLPVEEIAHEIAKSADFLAVDWADVPDRQRSMRAVFEWSWRLLNETEQQVLRQLALFAGSFTRAAAEQIAGASVRTLTGLLHKSLLHYAHTGEDARFTHNPEANPIATRRYELHELVRQFAAEQLTAAHERTTTEARYSAFYLAYLAACEVPLLGRAVRETVDEISRELDHVRQAWLWAIAQQQWTLIDQSAYALAEFFVIVGRSAEGEALFQHAADQCARQLSSAASAEPATQAWQRTWSKLLALVAIARYRQAKAEAVTTAQQAIRLGRASGSLEAQIMGYYAWALTATVNGRLAEAQISFDNMRLYLEQTRTQGTESARSKDFWWRYYLGLFAYAMQKGEIANAQAYGTEGLRIAQSLQTLHGQMLFRLNLIEVFEEIGDFARMQQEVELVLPVVQRMRWRWGECVAQKILGTIFTFRGEYALALAAYHCAHGIAPEIGEINLEIEITFYLAHLYTRLGDSERGQQFRSIGAPHAQQSAVSYVRIAALMVDTLQHWAWGEGNLLHAHEAATQAWTLSKAANQQYNQACVLVYLGHVQADMQQFTEATVAYQQAHHLFTTLCNPAMGAEAQAGLAQLALYQGNTAAAQQWVEEILPTLAAQPHAGVTTPFFTYLTCYQILAANADPRANSLLHQAYDLLQQDAATLDERTRHCFLTAVPMHRALVAAYRAMTG